MDQTIGNRPKARIRTIAEMKDRHAEFKKTHGIGEKVLLTKELGDSDFDYKPYIDSFSDQELLDGQKKNGEKLDLTKLNRLASDFKVNPEDYPIFDRQNILVSLEPKKQYERWNIDHTLSTYIGFTYDTIRAMDGSSEEFPKIDEAIYLDKSARPVSKLVEAFWEDFAEKNPDTGKPVEMPNPSFLNVDRLDWFRRVGIDVGSNSCFTDKNGVYRRIKIEDFEEAVKEGKLLPENIAAIHALYIKGGRTTDDLDEIMNTETTLDGKNIMIIDEVSDTGTTPRIAKILIEAAFPKAKSVQFCVFSHFGTLTTRNGDPQMCGSPVWYPGIDHSYEYGRGTLDLHPFIWDSVYEANPTPENYAKKKANFIVSAELDFDTEPFQESRELFREISQMAEDYRAGKILFNSAAGKWDDKAYLNILRQGINPNRLKEIKAEIKKRPPSKDYSSKFPPH